jgi:hypothetical protein
MSKHFPRNPNLPAKAARTMPMGGGPDPLLVTYDTTYYPYTSGYAQVSDVTSRISAGSWDPTDPTAYPTEAMVTSWLLDATGQLDAALAQRGYYVPLQADPGFTAPPGMATWNGIGLAAWLLLRNVAAAYAAHYVEASRHGSVGENEDPNATAWMSEFNAFLGKLSGSPPQDNLTAFGVAGAFAPMIDPASALASGSMGFMLSDSSQTNGPLFWKYQDLGSGWEGGDPTPESSS